MTPIEIMALIVALLGATKIIVILINPKSWMKVPKAVYKVPFVTAFVSIILAGVVLNFLLQELTIIQIFAVMLFLILLMMSSMAAFTEELMELSKKVLKNRFVLINGWLPTIVWLFLFAWVLYALFV